METVLNKWYNTLITECNTLGEKFGLDDPGTSELRDFVTRIAKEQYQSGNKSGIRWAYRKMGAQTGATVQA
ncbi:MAG TPA: hypothetical protein VJB99_03165 [Patescibacteria group bacterium]|nr:hypothetical protein [Patescibacteria group bacterium]